MFTAADDTPQKRYSRVAVLLHWLIAAAILLNIVLGVSAARIEDEEVHRVLLDIHKPLGVTVLALSLVRLAWRLTHRPPRLTHAVPAWQRAAATAVHALLYVLMIALPLTGWWLSSSVPTRHAISWLGLFDIPFLPAPRGMSMQAIGQTHDAHVALAYILIALFALHIGAVIKHHAIDRFPILRRMAWAG